MFTRDEKAACMSSIFYFFFFIYFYQQYKHTCMLKSLKSLGQMLVIHIFKIIKCANFFFFFFLYGYSYFGKMLKTFLRYPCVKKKALAVQCAFFGTLSILYARIYICGYKFSINMRIHKMHFLATCVAISNAQYILARQWHYFVHVAQS